MLTSYNALTVAQTSGAEVAHVTSLLIQLGITILGSLIGFLVASWVLRQTEWLRKLAGWEPYGRQLWEHKFTFYSKAYELVGRISVNLSNVLVLYRQCHEIGLPFDPNSELAHKLREAIYELQTAQLKGSLLISKEADAAIDLITEKAIEIVCLLEDEEPNENSLVIADKLTSELMQRVCGAGDAMKDCLGITTYQAAHKSSLDLIAASNTRSAKAPPRTPRVGS